MTPNRPTTPFKKFIIATFTIPGYHCWPGAPEENAFLRQIHRHLFYIRMTAPVSHEDREIEFISLTEMVREWMCVNYNSKTRNACDFGSLSCEMLATDLLMQFNLESCQVMEDNENGAIVYRNHEE